MGLSSDVRLDLEIKADEIIDRAIAGALKKDVTVTGEAVDDEMEISIRLEWGNKYDVPIGIIEERCVARGFRPKQMGRRLFWFRP